MLPCLAPPGPVCLHCACAVACARGAARRRVAHAPPPPHAPPPRRSLPLLPGSEPSGLTPRQQCSVIHAWCDAAMGVALPLILLAGMERRGRRQLFLRRLQCAGAAGTPPPAVYWSAEPHCPPALEPAFWYLASCATFVAATLAVSWAA